MKTALKILGALLGLDVLVLSYFFIFRAAHYFPDRYETAFAAGVYCVGIGIVLLIAFLAVGVIYLIKDEQKN
jgi:hypothetical protein